MPPVDTTLAGAEAAQKLGLGEATEITPEPVPGEEPEAPVEPTEPELAEPEEPATPAKKAETIPLQRFNEVYGRMKELERTLLEVAKEGRRPAPQQQQVVPPPDFDTMTNAELANYIMTQVGTKVGDIINKTVMPVQSQVEADRTARDIQATASKYPDFWDHREKMIALAERHPTLTAEEAYHLASGNPTALKKSIAQRVNAQVAKKKAARTEMRSSPAEKVAENTQYKTVREAGLAAAKKLGMIP
jgi:hypothetical protein